MTRVSRGRSNGDKQRPKQSKSSVGSNKAIAKSLSSAKSKKDYVVSKRKQRRESSETILNEGVPEEDIEVPTEVPVDLLNELPQTVAKLSYLSPQDIPFIKIEEPGLMSRLLYPNPVCFLTTIDTDGKKRNVMALSWITPANNYGGFVFCMHKTRHSAASIVSRKDFVLSVANSAQIDLLLVVGKRTGGQIDKFDGSIENLSLVPLGNYSATTKNAARDAINSAKKRTVKNSFSMLEESDSGDDCEDASNEEKSDCKNKEENKDPTMDSSSPAILSKPMAVAGSVAHMLCSVQSISDGADQGHHVVVCVIKEAHVHPSYWAKGKCLAVMQPEETIEGADGSPLSLPSVVTFLGSQQFGGYQMIESS